MKVALLVIALALLSIEGRRLPRDTLLADVFHKRKSCDTGNCEPDNECSEKENKYGWGLKGSSYGCCGNYDGCCKLATIFCYIHDFMCSCCGSILCGPQCKPEPMCEVDGSGEISR